MPSLPLEPGMAMQSEDNLMALIVRLLRDESGATAIEYAIIAGSLSIVILAAVQGIGTKLKSTLTTVEGALN